MLRSPVDVSKRKNLNLLLSQMALRQVIPKILAPRRPDLRLIPKILARRQPSLEDVPKRKNLRLLLNNNQIVLQRGIPKILALHRTSLNRIVSK